MNIIHYMLFVQFIQTLTVNMKEYSANYATFATIHNWLTRMRTPTKTHLPPNPLSPQSTSMKSSATRCIHCDSGIIDFLYKYTGETGLLHTLFESPGLPLPQLSVQSARRIVKSRGNGFRDRRTWSRLKPLNLPNL